MQYSATYNVCAGDYDLEYDKIVYNIDGKTKSRTIPTRTTTIRLDGKTYPIGKNLKDISSLI